MAHTHNIRDSDKYFIIDPVTREIRNDSGKVKISQYDHNSERFTFELPREIDGHDMSLCNKVEVHYINIDASTKERAFGVYEVDDLQLSPGGDDVVICSWLISGNATQFAGNLSFVIRYACVTDSVIDYAWNTAVYSDIAITSGIYNANAVATEYADILAAWKAGIDAALAAARSRLVSINMLAAAWNDNEDIYYSQVVSLAATENSKVDLQPSPELLATLVESGISLTTQNDNGEITVFAIGDVPETDIVMQAVITEVDAS